MKSKSTTQKLKILWQDRAWSPRIESRPEASLKPADRVAIYQTNDECPKSDTQLIVRHKRVVSRSGARMSFKQPWKN